MLNLGSGSSEIEKIYIECLSKLYGMIGLLISHKMQKNEALVNYTAQTVCKLLITPLEESKRKRDFVNLTDNVRLIVEFSKGF